MSGNIKSFPKIPKNYKEPKPEKSTNRSRMKYLVTLCRMLDVEMDGVECPATAASILNAIRATINELPN